MFAGRCRFGAIERKRSRQWMLAAARCRFVRGKRSPQGVSFPPRDHQLLRSLILSATLTPEFAIPIGRAMNSMNFVMSTEGCREA
ncbi:hypothetical protein EV184_101357 [Sinorhizobium americanum]|uniref:Uncharacterized protein n=1 Tax=Sinorhizobium americanum TaxID=194963 RepID=A0A4R2C6Z1_9HYPH|nr:hypothetical protein EV184_101357 [Sinorhizobium americanum]